MLTERSRRVWAASEALALGHGGIGLVERATGISRSTISRGIHELDAGESLSGERTRRPGGGRKRTVEKDDRLVADLDALVEPTASGNPDSPLRWTSKSVRHLATELQAMGHEVSYRLVMQLLHAADYSLQANRKTREGPQHPDRNAQFQYLSDQVRRFQHQHRPAISVDTKKKGSSPDRVGDFEGFHSSGSMQVRTLRRRYSGSRRPQARRCSTRILLFSPSTKPSDTLFFGSQ